MAESWEEDCLAYDPFSGDTDGDVTPLRDRFIITRKPHTCNVCIEQIQSRSRVRAITEVFDGSIRTTYFCFVCCRAMATSWTDDGKAIEARCKIGFAATHPDLKGS